MVSLSTSIVKKSLEDLGTNKARELRRAVRDFLGRWSSGSAPLGGVVRSVMTVDVLACTAADTLHRAAQIMWERDCGAVPVVDAAGRVAGIVTDRDLAMGAFTQGLPLVAIPVGRVASGRVHTVSVGASVDDAVAVMGRERVRRVVVVDAHQKVVGIVSLADVARFVAGLGPTRRDAALVLAGLVAALSERRQSTGSTDRAAE
ncbi:MAG TPA: CBS domain-containing protein [Polyangiaceae bacterium]|nr:CBS domain-containing protein [Polyangiaceae bacterium]